MNNRGFTLIELIIVISILAMLALLSTPNIIKMIEKNKVNNYNSTIDSIIEAAELYVSDNRYDLIFEDKDNDGNSDYCTQSDTKDIYTSVTLQELIDRKAISTPVKNNCTDKEIASNTEIVITLNCSTRQFSYDINENTSGIDDNNDKICDECTLKRRKEDGVSIDGIKGLKVTSCSDLYK